MEKVIILCGPTGVGKTYFSLKLAQKYHFEIINCDASQMKRYLDIGTGKTDLLDSNIPHHFINIINPDELYSIKDFQINARKKTSELSKLGKISLVCGGSGLYINSLLFDYDLNSSGRNDDFSKKYEELTNHDLHDLLEKLDKSKADLIHENNRRRVLRAIERIENGDRISNNDTNLMYDALIIFLNTDRDVLYERINNRVEEMINLGLIDEAKSLIGKFDTKKIKDIGYFDIFKYINGEVSLDEAKSMIKQRSRNYAKRQLTWFRNKLDAIEVKVDYNNLESTFNELDSLVNDFISK